MNDETKLIIDTSTDPAGADDCLKEICQVLTRRGYMLASHPDGMLLARVTDRASALTVAVVSHVCPGFYERKLSQRDRTFAHSVFERRVC